MSRLRQLGLFNDSPDTVLDGFTRLAAAATGLQAAALTLVESHTLLVKSAVGFPVGRLFARHETFCTEALDVQGVFEVPDARLDYRFQQLPIVATGDGAGLVHYAGAALRMPGGEAIGTLCVGGIEPGRLGDSKRRMLADLASQVVELLLAREREQQLAREKLLVEAVNLSELSPVGMFSADADGRVVHGNGRWARMLGAERYEELLGDAWLQAIAPEHRDEVATAWEDGVRGRSTVNVRFRTAGSDARWIRMQVTPVDTGTETMSFVAATTDISETVRLSESMAAKKHMLETIIEHLPCGLTVFDADLKHLATNPAARRMLALPDSLFERENLSYRDVSRYAARRGDFGPGDPELLVADRVRSIVDETRYAHERRSPSGTIMEVRGRRTPQGLVVATYNDVTQARQANRELQLSRDAADKANRAKTQFLTNMSHEIRTPLNGVIGLSKLLKGAELPHAEADAVEMIDSCAHSLLSLVDNILDLSRIEAGQLTLDPVPFDLHQLLKEVADVFGVRASDKGLHFKVSRGRDVPQWVLADPGRLRQVLLNLLSNALKFTPQGGFALRVAGGASELAFAVSDSGIGISPEDQKRLFARFTQVDASPTRRFEGTGLGLAISRQLGQLMGGDVTVESVPGEGSTFTLRVPLQAAQEPASDAPALERARNARARILLAEDNPINQLVARKMLASLGYEDVTVVDDGVAALQACEEQSFALVLMDCQMPRMGGLEATRTLRARRFHAPVIAFTASATSEDRNACLGAGMNDYLSKPIEMAVLASKLNRWLAGVTEPMALPVERVEVPFDHDVVENVFMGDVDMFEQTREIFLRNTRDMLRDLTAAVAAEDWSLVRRLAHKIRGGAGQLGASLLAQQALPATGAVRRPGGAAARLVAARGAPGLRGLQRRNRGCHRLKSFVRASLAPHWRAGCRRRPTSGGTARPHAARHGRHKCRVGHIHRLSARACPPVLIFLTNLQPNFPQTSPCCRA